MTAYCKMHVLLKANCQQLCLICTKIKIWSQVRNPIISKSICVVLYIQATGEELNIWLLLPSLMPLTVDLRAGILSRFLLLVWTVDNTVDNKILINIWRHTWQHSNNTTNLMDGPTTPPFDSGQGMKDSKNPITWTVPACQDQNICSKIQKCCF